MLIDNGNVYLRMDSTRNTHISDWEKGLLQNKNYSRMLKKLVAAKETLFLQRII